MECDDEEHQCEICNISGKIALVGIRVCSADLGVMFIGPDCLQRLQPLIQLWQVLNHAQFYEDENLLYQHIVKYTNDCMKAVNDVCKKYASKK